MKNEDIPCVYQIVNMLNNKRYIGSASNFSKRKNMHLSELRNNKHHSSHLQNAWNKYGEDNFVFEILEKVKNKEELISVEQYWINHYSSHSENNGYNILPVAGSRLGFKATEETKNKQSESSKGRVFSKEELEKRSGEMHSNSILKESQVIDIKRLILDSDLTIAEIANIYNVGTSVINNIVIGSTWKDTGGITIEQRGTSKRRKASNKFTSNYKGVSFNSRSSCFVVSFTYNKNRFYLGKYDSEIIAANVYNHKVVEVVGNDAILNNVEYVSKEDCEKLRKGSK